jgi:hypothetical protein
MNHGYPFVAWLRRSVPLVCGPVLMLALMEAMAFGSCGDYLMPASGEHASVATSQNRNKNGSLAASINDFERDGMPIKGPSRCSSGRDPSAPYPDPSDADGGARADPFLDRVDGWGRGLLFKLPLVASGRRSISPESQRFGRPAAAKGLAGPGTLPIEHRPVAIATSQGSEPRHMIRSRGGDAPSAVSCSRFGTVFGSTFSSSVRTNRT